MGLAPLSLAQRPVPADYTLNVDVEFVHLPVSVIDKEGYPFSGLTQEHFRVYEDRVMQDISFFKQEDVPLTIGLVLDTSGSMRYEFDQLRTAALTLVQESNAEDETFIVTFGSRPNLAQNFTFDIRDLSASLNRVQVQGTTSLYDAVMFAANHIEKGFHGKKALIVISDGEDNNSLYKLEEVLEQIRESKMILYTIGLTSHEVVFLDTWLFKASARKVMEQFAKVTGGRSFFPRSMAKVEEICRTIARDLRNQYTLGYRPSNTNLDGSWRKIRVQVDPPAGTPKLRVHNKQGYYAPLVGKRVRK
jgi:Ca-activated chloride channel homolog